MKKIKVNNKMVKRFLEIMDDYNEFVFYDSMDYLKKQLEMVLNSQGYWSGNSIKLYYDIEKKDFYIKNRW